MADTLESIFLNTSLGPTELDDGEHTLVTTNSTTSFVIKDMHVNGTSTLTNTHLDLNGFNVSGITSNATGSLIIPPNSTLKIKTTDYPFKYIEQKDIMGLSGFSVASKVYLNPDGTRISGVDAEHYYTRNSASLNNQLQDMEWGLGGSGSTTRYTYHYSSDLNSSHQLYGVQDGGYNHTNSEDNMNGASYDPKAFGYNSSYGKIAVYLNSGSLVYYPLVGTHASAGAIASVTPTNFGTGSFPNGQYQETTASYPYGFCAHDYFWYIPSNSFGNYIYGINLETGQPIRHNFNQAPNAWQGSLGGSDNHFVVAYRPSDDRFVVYNSGSNNIYYSVFQETKTTLDALSQNSTYNTGKFAGGQFGVPSGSLMTSYSNSSVLGFDIDGNVIYHQNGGSIIASDISGGQVTLADNGNTRNIGDFARTDTSRISTRRFKRLSTHEQTSLNLPVPTFGIQLLGVRSTT